MFRRIFVCMLLMLLTLGLFAGCQEEASPSESVTFTVTFAMKGHIVSKQTVRMGDKPQEVTPQIEGLRFCGWTDSTGADIDPFAVVVKEDLRFEAVAYPELSNHVPFLFTDDVGHLRPDDMLTADDVYNALHALATAGADAYFPGLYTGSAKVSQGELTEVLSHFFPESEVFAAVTQEPTRASFAQSMLTLLGRSIDEAQTVAEDAVIPGDVHTGRTDAAWLLEACLAHTPDENGTAWEAMELPSAYEPGFVNIEGWLYYVKEDGYFLKDGDLGDLHFGPDGRYTSGDAELDAMVAELLKKFIEENPDKTQFELLRVAYDHSYQDYKYLRKEAYLKGATGWEIEDAKEMISTGRGNCYNFAAIFWALARGLGYEAYAISGNCTGSVQPHGWVQISFDGEPYFFDPEWHFAYINENRPVKDMFMISMDDAWYWSYDWYPI